MNAPASGRDKKTCGISVLTGPSAASNSRCLEAFANNSARAANGRPCGFADAAAPLLSTFDVRMNVMLPRLYHFREPRAAARRHADALLDRTGFEGSRDETPARLTPLETMQALIARALALESSRIFINEPFSMETITSWPHLGDCLRSLAREGDTGVVVATRNLAFASTCADNMIFVHDGVIESYESWQAFAAAPGPSGFIGALPFAPGAQA
ncbi:MAG TPA: hypothetical protein VF267_05150 [Gammaproteobacteria bacterium]